MKISVAKAAGEKIALAFDDTQVTLGAAETKILLLELTRILMPVAAGVPAPKRAAALGARLKGAKGLGVQRLLRMADHDDLLVLLKFGEGDDALLAKIYGNMTEKARKIYAEDLAYRFREGVPEDRLGQAADRLNAIVRELEQEGAL